jgi:hypothetical protein
MNLRLPTLFLSLCCLPGCCGTGDPSDAKLTEWRTKIIGMQRVHAVDYLRRQGLLEDHLKSTIEGLKSPYPGGLEMDKQTSTCWFKWEEHSAVVVGYVDKSGTVVSAQSMIWSESLTLR